MVDANFFATWSDTSYLLSDEGDLMPPPLYLLEVVWYTYLQSSEGSIMPHPYIYCKWYDTKTYNLLKVLGDLMPPPLYLL